jgi:steroid 5-alpha reductase family enzyme
MHLIGNLLLALLFMTAVYFIARLRNRLDTVDAAWGLGFVVIAWVTELRYPNGLSALLVVMVSIWGLRLSFHLWQRTRFRSDDKRYQELTKRWEQDVWKRAFYSIFLVQGFLVWLISLPVQLSSNPSNQLVWLTALGLIVWIAGFVIESLADRQLQDYLRTKDRPPVLKSGLWRYSRHPNYFGELTQWWAIGLIALQVSYGWVGLVGPLVLTYLIIFVSGLPPIERSRRDNKDYQQYKQQTSALIPLPPRK